MVKSYFRREAFRSGSRASAVSGSGLSPGGDKSGRTRATLGGEARIDDATSAPRIGGWHRTFGKLKGKLTGGTILEHEKRGGIVSGFPAESAGDELT